MLHDSGSQPPGASERHIPWWMAIVGLSYVVTFGVIFYLIIWGPSELRGFVSTFSGGAMSIHSVEADSQVAKGGLRAGDRVLMIDGQDVRSVRDWVERTGNSEAWRPQTWVVSRGGERVTLEIVSTATGFRSKLLDDGYVLYLSLALTGFCLGFLIAWKRPADPIGRIGAWFIITASIAFGFPVGWAVPWRALPFALQLLLWIPQLSRFVLEAIFLSFFAVFPRRLVTRRWVWFLIWAPVVATLPWRVKSFYGVIHPGQIAPVPGWILTAGFIRTMVYLLVGFVLLTVSYRRFLDLNEKRRVRVLMLGTAVSLISATVLVWFDTFSGRMTSLRIVIFLVAPFNTACPVSLGYAILRHRVLDISVIIRQGLRYGLARGAVIGLVPVLAALFVLDLAANRQQTLADIFQSRGWVYAALAGLSILAYWKRREWLESIDRRFFRERYDARKVLRGVVGEIGSARDFETAALRVVERIEAALHSEFAALMVCPAGKPEFRAVALSPLSNPAPSLPADAKFIALLRVLGKPLEVLHRDSSWLDQRLPHEEREIIRRSRIDLLVPVATGPDRAEAFLALGVKRSEEPYTGEDQELLETITASLALLLQRPAFEAEEQSRELKAERWERIEQLFHSALEQEPGRREKFLREACAGDDSLRATVGSMLARDAGSPDFRELRALRAEVQSLARDLEGKTTGEKLSRSWASEQLGQESIKPDGPLCAGTRLGPYEIIAPIGAGGMGKVYKARDTRLDRSVAIKVSNEEFSERFEREARAVAALNHPRICTLHDVGPNYLVMEYLEGVPITGPLSIKTASEYAGQILDALEAAHAKGIIHRDLKPSNILLTNQGIKLLDFGLAKVLRPPAAGRSDVQTKTLSLTQPGAVLGTPAYVSPEQLRGQIVDHRTDIWSFGCVLYELLTGKHPFKGETVTETLAKVLERDPDWKVLPPSTPETIRELLERCLQKNPALRLPSVGDARRLLAQSGRGRLTSILKKLEF